MAAASLARRMLRSDTACGLLVGSQLAGGRRWAYLPPSAAASQLGRIEDVLARVQPILSLPFERLLGVVPRRLAPGGTVLSLGARDPEALRRQPAPAVAHRLRGHSPLLRRPSARRIEPSWPHSACRRASPSSSRTGGGLMRSSWPADRIVGWILPILAILAEGAWLAVVYVAVETTIDGRAPLLGTFELAAAAGLAAIAVRRGLLRPDDNPLTFFVALVAFGAVGWLWDDRVRSLVFAGDLAGAIGLHPGGWLLLVAAMRGVGRGVEIDDRALTRLVLRRRAVAGHPMDPRPARLRRASAGLRRARVRRQPDVRLGRIHGRRPCPPSGDRQRDGRRLAHESVVARHRARRARHRARRWRAGRRPARAPGRYRRPRTRRSVLQPARLPPAGGGLRGSHPVCRALRGAEPDRDRAARTAEPGGARPAAGRTGIHHRAAPGTDHDGRHPVDRRDPPGGDRAPHVGHAPGSWPTARRDRGAVVQHSAGFVPAPSAADRRTRSTGPARSPDRRGWRLSRHPRRPGGARPMLARGAMPSRHVPTRPESGWPTSARSRPTTRWPDTATAA